MRALAVLLPTWAVVAIGLVLAVFLIRGFDFRTRTRQIREAVRRLVRAPPDARDAIVARAFERAGENPELVALLVAEAARRHMPQLHAAAMAKLASIPGAPAQALLLHARGARAAATPLHPIESALRVRAAIEEGLVEIARARLEEALETHPDHPDLLALRGEIDALAPGSPSQP
jgi:hypothetical protein